MSEEDQSADAIAWSGRQSVSESMGGIGDEQPWPTMTQGACPSAAFLAFLDDPERAVLVSTEENGIGSRSTWQIEAGLPDAGEALLRGYESMGDVELVMDCYLDLFQRVWGCVVRSPCEGWAEVAIVDERWGDGGGRGCQVCVIRMPRE